MVAVLRPNHTAGNLSGSSTRPEPFRLQHSAGASVDPQRSAPNASVRSQHADILGQAVERSREQELASQHSTSPFPSNKRAR